MKLLLDTHTFLWWISDSSQLSRTEFIVGFADQVSC